MPKTVVFIHTVPQLIELFNKLGAQLLPGVELLHILDEVMFKRVRLKGGTDEQEKQWLISKVSSAEEVHANAVLVTCTILSGYIDEIRPITAIPIIKIDEAMIERAVDIGERIGMVVTNRDTTEPTSQIIVDYAASIGKPIMVKPVFVEYAFNAVRNGDGETHDRLVKQAILDVAPSVDVIILAQASMARVLELIPESERQVPILASPYLALAQVQTALQQVILK
jgi:Asp/Glu/hydantoin racemase